MGSFPTSTYPKTMGGKSATTECAHYVGSSSGLITIVVTALFLHWYLLFYNTPKIYICKGMHTGLCLLIYRWWRSVLSFRCYACWWIPKIYYSDKRAPKKRTAEVYISRHRRAAPILPTKTKLLSSARLDYIVNSAKRHLDWLVTWFSIIHKRSFLA